MRRLSSVISTYPSVRFCADIHSQPVNDIRAEERDLLQVQFDSAERKRNGRINDARKEEIHAKVCEALDWETI